MRILKRILIVLAILFVAIQVVRPEKTNPVIDIGRTIQARTQMSEAVSSILQRSCMDCHSYKTVWPWYSNVAPASWLLASDVREAREHLSLSDWAAYDKKKALRKLDEMCDEVSKGDMPPSSYTLMHSAARLSDEDRKTICDWTKDETRRIESGS
jgi:cytochrome c551/c552